MAISLVMSALEMAQETGILVRWLKLDGQSVTKGEPVMEVETDKVTVEIEAPASGILGGVQAREGDVIPVGQTIAWILAAGEAVPAATKQDAAPLARSAAPVHGAPVAPPAPKGPLPEISPVARKMAEEYGLDPARLSKPGGKRIEKADVQAYLDAHAATTRVPPDGAVAARLAPASPKARRLAAERGIELATLAGSGPGGAVLALDVPAVAARPAAPAGESMGTTWRVMAAHMSESWTTVPHFYLVREVDATRLVEWRSHSAPLVEKGAGLKLTYTDLLVRLLGAALRAHPRLNAAWDAGSILLNPAINVGIATATEEGLIVPVIRDADKASLGEIAAQRSDLLARAHERRLRPADISGGTFTLTNLGMYHVDAFSAIVNTPQVAILAVGRIAERVVPLNGQPAVRPMLVLTLSCDHRVVDGARAAQFLDELANLIEDPWRLLL